MVVTQAAAHKEQMARACMYVCMIQTSNKYKERGHEVNSSACPDDRKKSWDVWPKLRNTTIIKHFTDFQRLK